MVSKGPEPEKLAITRAAAHTVEERGIFTIIAKHYIFIRYIEDTI